MKIKDNKTGKWKSVKEESDFVKAIKDSGPIEEQLADIAENGITSWSNKIKTKKDKNKNKK